MSSLFLVVFSESGDVFSKKNTSRHSRGVFMVDGCGHHFECLILVGLDCEGSCSRAQPSHEGIELFSSLSYYVLRNINLFSITS